ncbi:hypothetical protein CC85DRAFT_288616 [Cutaneotrichosporon oleaginosum]|uniref:Uncharacterized protein n=1 Tax=Cutaneotrichosporon oleaginosum TaxID=879819 RepID=A0A0J0XE86_9TREE|nr:uncharacterized protein CC85DRAFT_288616 [Cutaneotrichosporon oleaginosum]KLT39363.1 hypothetical protein CC85DRAFT_288616 [Cutaneotrichosporon oleaginosum]TXT12091.1 hypothetical protein COLE_02501 [Cutaneotrichosporon oleaginosum]
MKDTGPANRLGIVLWRRGEGGSASLWSTGEGGSVSLCSTGEGGSAVSSSLMLENQR